MAARTFPRLRGFRLIYRKEVDDYSPGFHCEKASLELFWNRHWINWQRQRASMLQRALLSDEVVDSPEFVFWSREQLEAVLPMEEWKAENFSRRSRGSPEPLYGRNALSFFQPF